MAKFDHQTLKDLKKLCKLDCSQEEDEEILKSLPKVLSYIETLNEVDTENVSACRYVLKGMLYSPLRKDIPASSLSREEFLLNAPDEIGGMIKVPPVLNPSS